MKTREDSSTSISPTKDSAELRRRYNKLVVIDLKKRGLLRNLVRYNTRCEHKQIYTQANAICRRISSSFEEGKISVNQAMDLMMEAHDKMSHKNMPKDVICDEMNKRLNKFDRGTGSLTHEVTMANVSVSNSLDHYQEREQSSDSEGRYSESYWAEVI